MRCMVIEGRVLDRVLQHCSEAMPDEACGLLAGSDGVVTSVFCLSNVNPSPVSYTIDPAQHMDAMKRMSSEGLDLLGIFHSHPQSPPLPSLTDVERAFFPGTRELNYPGVAYVIVGLADLRPQVNAFVIEPSGVRKIPLEIRR